MAGPAPISSRSVGMGAVQPWNPLPIMKRFCLYLAVVGAFGLPHHTLARDNTAVGVGTGAVAGALVAGPLGAVVGGIVGGVVGANSERTARPRRSRRPRAMASRARASSGREPARIAQRAAPVSVTAAETPRPVTTWTNPR